MYNTIILEKRANTYFITFNRINARNSINKEFMDELNSAFDIAEHDCACKIVVLQGKDGVFCTGMDFQQYADARPENETCAAKDRTSGFITLIRRISLFPKVIISKVDGQVLAGGVGIVAASDLVFASKRARFSLSEILWGLLPSMVLPYLIRRVGFQNAYRMTLTSLPVGAEEAKIMNLVDEVDDNLDGIINRYSVRLVRIDSDSIKTMKEYFRKLWIISGEMEQTAAAETNMLSASPKVSENIRNFVKYKKFPWESK